MTEVFISAECQRFPRMTRNPASVRSGAAAVAMTPASFERAPRVLAPMLAPVTVIGAGSSSPASSSSPIMARTPPARWKASQRWRPAGWTLASRGSA